MYSQTPIEVVFKRDRIIVISGIAVVSVLAWMYMIYLTWSMKNLDMSMEMSLPQMQSWGVVDFSLMFVMWAVMMVAMMVPSAAPTVLMFARIYRKRCERQEPVVSTGIFQFTPLKYACLTRCRSPLGFILNEWREGILGAFIMGFRNGNYCVICCWALMSLMFIAGVMSLLWMAVIAAFVLVEKVAPGGRWVSRISGLLLILWGSWMLMGA